jgi:demethylspheroidene O-methyltransferase
MLDLLWRWRDQALADRRFLRVASRFPLTRPIARKQAAALFDLCAGFVYSQTLAACVELDLFDRLADHPQTEAEIATFTALPEPGARALLDAAVALRLLARRRGARYGLGSLGAAMRGNPGIAAMVRHHSLLYRDLADPVALLRGGNTYLGGYWPYAAGAAGSLTAQDVGAYTALMAASQPMIADQVISCYNFAANKCLLDVGGGDGSFLESVGARFPQLSLMLFDLQAVIPTAEARFATSPLAGRLTCRAGDFTTAPLPSGADLISFVRVLHDHDDAVVQHLLAAARAALPPGGTVLIAEPMANSPRAAAYFSLYLRAMGSGRPRSVESLSNMLRAAGFASVREISTPTPLLVRVLTASVGETIRPQTAPAHSAEAPTSTLSVNLS